MFFPTIFLSKLDSFFYKPGAKTFVHQIVKQNNVANINEMVRRMWTSELWETGQNCEKYSQILAVQVRKPTETTVFFSSVRLFFQTRMHHINLLLMLWLKLHIKHCHVEPIFTRFLFLCPDDHQINEVSWDENKTWILLLGIKGST